MDEHIDGYVSEIEYLNERIVQLEYALKRACEELAQAGCPLELIDSNL